MEINLTNVSHLEADALLPPRKRLLAGLKRQNSDVNFDTPLSSCSTTREYDARLNNLFRSYLSCSKHSDEAIVNASRLAAVEAAKVAEAARVTAEEKAAKAAKAVAAAKTALELVATLSEEASSREKYMKKNKMKKHVPVQTLYSKNKGVKNCRTDEELARKLHVAINSSPRISKNTSMSDLNNHKRKRLKGSTTKFHNGDSVWNGNRPSTSNGNATVQEVDSLRLVQERNLISIDLNASKFDKVDQMAVENGEGSRSNKIDGLKLENGEAKMIRSKEKLVESSNDLCGSRKKGGKIKQKKLPLSICSFRDQIGSKDEPKSKIISQTEYKTSKATVSNKPLFSVGPSGNSATPMEKTSTWKCQAFKSPACVKQNKVMR